MLQELATWVAALPVGWGDESDDDMELFMNDSHGLGEVGIVADYDGAIHGFPMGIVNQVRGQIDVGSFFLSPQDFREAPPVGPRKGDSVRKESTQDDLDRRKGA